MANDVIATVTIPRGFHYDGVFSLGTNKPITSGVYVYDYPQIPGPYSVSYLIGTAGVSQTIPAASFYVKVDPTVAGAASPTASAAVSSALPDSNSKNNQESFPAVKVVQNADLDLSIQGPATTVAVGDTVTYTVKVANLGPDPATNVVLSAPLNVSGLQILSVTPSPATMPSTLASGATFTMVVQARTTRPSSASSVPVGFTENVQGNGVIPSNHTRVQVDTDVANRAVLSVSLTGTDKVFLANPSTPNKSEFVTYNITITNNVFPGSPGAAAQHVHVTDVLPLGVVAYQVAPARSGNFGAKSDRKLVKVNGDFQPQYTVAADLGTLDPGQTLRVQIKAILSPNADSVYLTNPILSNTATVSADNSPALTTSPVQTNILGSGFGLGLDAYVETAFTEILGRPPTRTELLVASGLLALNPDNAEMKTKIRNALWQSPERQNLVALGRAPKKSDLMVAKDAEDAERQFAQLEAEGAFT